VRSGSAPGLSIEELLALPAVVDLTTAGRAWRMGHSKAAELARAGEFPCPVLRLGRYWKVRKVELLRSLGVDPDSASAGLPSSSAASDNRHMSFERATAFYMGACQILGDNTQGMTPGERAVAYACLAQVETAVGLAKVICDAFPHVPIGEVAAADANLEMLSQRLIDGISEDPRQ
jgi:hypothetical protein